jgi:hypothetical protein
MAYIPKHEIILAPGDTWDVLLYPFAYCTAAGSNVALLYALAETGGGVLFFEQDSTGGRALTLGGTPVTVDTEPGAVTWVEIARINGRVQIKGKAANAGTGDPDGTADNTAPTVTFEALSPTVVRATFSEAMGAVTIAGFSFNNGSTVTPSAVTPASSTVYDFTVSGLAQGQTINAAYNAGSGATTDSAGNELSTFSGANVVNSITAAGTLVFHDDFSGPSGDLDAHAITPVKNVGSGNWVESAGTWITNGLVCVPTHALTLEHTYYEFGSADGIYSVLTKRGVDATDQALMFRYQDDDNYWIADMQVTGTDGTGTFSIWEKLGGTFFERAHIPKVFTPETVYEIQVTLSGNDLTATVDGVSTLTVNSASGATRTKHGMWSSGFAGAHVWFNHFKKHQP